MRNHSFGVGCKAHYPSGQKQGPQTMAPTKGLLAWILTGLTIFTTLVDANALPTGNCLGGPVSVSRNTNITDIFVIGADGLVYTGSLVPGDVHYGGHWTIPGFQSVPCAPIAAVSHTVNHLDVFAIGKDKRIFQA